MVKTKDVVEKAAESFEKDNRVELQIQIPENQPGKSILKAKTTETSSLSPQQPSHTKETTIIKFNNDAPKDAEGKAPVKIVKIKRKWFFS